MRVQYNFGECIFMQFYTHTILILFSLSNRLAPFTGEKNRCRNSCVFLAVAQALCFRVLIWLSYPTLHRLLQAR